MLAGAGTGKTYMLAERYYFHLNSDGFSPLEVVAMTFTNKAAAELRSRIRQTIAQNSPDRADWLAEVEALKSVHFMPLPPVFAANILRKREFLPILRL